MPQLRMNKPLEEDICIHLFSVSAAMVGVCLTVTGLIRVIISTRNINTVADDLLSVDALFFFLRMSLCLLGLTDAQYSSNALRGKDCRWGLRHGFDPDGGCLRHHYLFRLLDAVISLKIGSFFLVDRPFFLP